MRSGIPGRQTGAPQRHKDRGLPGSRVQLRPVDVVASAIEDRSRHCRESATMSDFELPVTRYAQSGDINIAYQAMGNGPVDIIMVPGFISHVEFMHEMIGYTSFLRRLSAFARVVTFDKRGQGLSDRAHGIAPLEQRMDDVRAIMDDIGSQRAVLLRILRGLPDEHPVRRHLPRARLAHHPLRGFRPICRLCRRYRRKNPADCGALGGPARASTPLCPVWRQTRIRSRCSPNSNVSRPARAP